MDLIVVLTGVLPGILIAAAILTAPIAFLLIGLYRSSVIRLMSKRAQPAPGNSAIPDETESPSFPVGPKFAPFDEKSAAKGTETITLFRHLRIRRWQTAAVYALGGLGFAILLTVAINLAWQLGFPPLNFIYFTLIYFWPAALVINLVASSEWRTGILIFAAYFFLWLVVSAVVINLSSSLTWGQTIRAWANSALLPTILVLMFLYRRIRAVGPMALIFLSFSFSGFHLFYMLGESILRASTQGNISTPIFIYKLLEVELVQYGVLALLIAISIFFMATLGWLTLQLLKWLYLHRLLSDHSFILDPIWLLFGLSTSIDLAFENPWWILTGLVAFGFYKILIWAGFAFSNGKRKKMKGTDLLLLRVFSLGKRSEQLYSAIAQSWRYVGNIHFITGPDLATSTVEPHRFLDYISRRLQHHFIDSAEALERRIQNADIFPGPDGRYRILDFFCYDDTWKMVLSRLAKDTDVILMDLRKFSRTNAGCVFEINELVHHVPLQRVVFVIDRTTDEVFLRESIENAWKRLFVDSPNREKDTKVHLLHYDETRPGAFRQLLYALSVAATSS
ncbi:MAG TPA: hypothetical protein VFQ13_14610 [Anaerolineales bacterium]|nr:hypothetical protein [Anaerolineales bacterium]